MPWMQTNLGSVLGIPLQAWDAKHIKQILVGMGEVIEVDEDVEEKQRLDRARVLVKTPWRPKIQHFVDVHIGGEVFKVDVVEECGCGIHDRHIGQRSFMGSSDEVHSEDNYLKSLSLRSMDMPELEGDLPKGIAPDRRTKLRGTTGSTIASSNDLGTHALPCGQTKRDDPLGKGFIPRPYDGRQSSTNGDQPTRQRDETTATNPVDVMPKQGKAQNLRKITYPTEEKLIHEKGNQERGVGSDEAMSLLLFENAERVNGMGKGCSNKGVGLSIQSPIKQMENMGQERVVGSDEAMSLPLLENAECVNGMGEGCLNKGVGLSIHSLVKQMDHMGHSPKHISGSNSKWQVYSRNWRCKKKLQTGFAQIDTASTTNTSSPHIQYPRDMEQAGNGLNENSGSATEPITRIEGDNVNHQIQEAAEIWSMAKQLRLQEGLIRTNSLKK